MDDEIQCPSEDLQLCRSKPRQYKSHDFMGYCLPDMQNLKQDNPEIYARFKDAFTDVIDSSPSGKVVQSISSASKIILWSIPTSFVLCMLYILLLSVMAEILAWVIVVLG